ncbi:MAG: dTDP-4-dehydrorhamnose reductase [bacterium]
MKILVTGARGMMGTDMCDVLAQGHDVAGVDIEDFDILNGEAVLEAIEALAPEIVVHLAGFTRVEDAEDQKDEAFNTNAVGTMNMAKASRDAGARLIYVSTDYVFDGSKDSPYVETDIPAPINFYGLTKLFGERYASSLNPRHLIVRTSWLYGPNGKNFVDTILARAREGAPLRVVDDQRGSPTYTCHLARGIRAALEKGVEGTLHMANSGETTWYEFARTALELAGLEAEIKPVSSSEYVTKAARPKNSVLGSLVIGHAGLEPLPDWKHGLREHLARREAAQ